MPPHPRPALYRQLVYAMAAWCEERELQKLDALPVVFAKALFGDGKRKPRARQRRPKR